MIRVLISASEGDVKFYGPALREALAPVGAELIEPSDPRAQPEAVDYIVVTPFGPIEDFSPYTNAKAVLSLWAGVERIVGNTTLTQPLARMVDSGMTEGMREYVVGHVMRYHLGLDADILNPEGKWAPRRPPLARERLVAILGLGELGQAAARLLQAIGFQVEGWARRAKTLDDLPCHAGRDGLLALLGRADMIVCLLPDTPETENTLDAQAFAAVKPGAVLLNPGRGPLIDDAALIEALDAGRIGHATLDVFREEPLPPEHPFWTHPKVTVTPHIAAATRPVPAARAIAENIRRGEAGEPFLHLVDRSAGY